MSLYVLTWHGSSAHVAAVTVKICQHYFFLMWLSTSLHIAVMHIAAGCPPACAQTIFGSTDLSGNVSRCERMRNVVSRKCETVAFDAHLSSLQSQK